jgi:hypothetical protein
MTSWNSTELQTQHSNIYDEKKYEDYGQLGASRFYNVILLIQNLSAESK